MEPLPKKQIPESKIALNPVVIDDSKRGLPPQNNIPPDMDALLAWLNEQVLEFHRQEQTCMEHKLEKAALVAGGQRLFANRVIAKIENSRVNQHQHVPQGWDEV